MVKSQSKKKKVNRDDKVDSEATQKDQQPHLKSSERRLKKKISFYQKVNDAVASANAVVSLKTSKSISKKSAQRQRRRLKKLKAYDFSVIADLLPEVTAPPTGLLNKNQCLTQQIKKQNIVQTESAQLQEVLKHPSFQADPFGALHQHLLATQPPCAPKENRFKADKKDGSKRQRKKKALSAPQPMEIGGPVR